MSIKKLVNISSGAALDDITESTLNLIKWFMQERVERKILDRND